MLSSLEIQNFKGIKQGKLENLTQVNILVGRNNSGKSTVLDALILLRSAVVGYDHLERMGVEQILRRRVDTGRENVSYDELWFRMETSDAISVDAEFDTNDVLKCEWRSSGNTNLPEGHFRIGKSPRSLDHSWANRGDGNHAKNFSNSNLIQSINNLGSENTSTFLALVHLLEANLIHQGFDEGFWYELAKDRKDRKVIEMLNAIYQTDIEGLNFSLFPPPRRRLVAARSEESVAVDWFGDGFRYAVNILSFGAVLHDTALLVEELETHQHPESLRMLINTLFVLAKQQNLQLFLTTHSMELITYALEAAEEKQIDLKLHHLNLNQEGILRSIPMSSPSATMFLDIGHDPRLHYKYIGAE